MTPFRSYIVTAALAANVAILGTVQLKGGVITYIVVSTLTEYTDIAHKPTLCITVLASGMERTCQSITSCGMAQ